MAGRLEGKIAIITGGNSGIGEGTSHRFAEEGAKVVLMARREDKGVAVQDAIRAKGWEAIYIQCDVSITDSVNAAVQTAVAAYGGVDILFNNAGFGAGEQFPGESDESWDRVINANLSGTHRMTRAVWPHMSGQGGGAIVNMSSIAAVIGFSKAMYDIAGRTPSASYYVAKAGIEALTRHSASMGGQHNIRVNCIRPGQVITPGATGGGKDHVFKSLFDRTQILDGPGYPVDVANLVLFLCSDEARFITGEMINIDGGTPRKL
jgi:NAD(P)-dependent dehydrogenase (short-subunit alcohol dehydrogenase family)